MSKTRETKEQILNILKASKKTVTELSNELQLSKSTVSQHMAELQRIGAVRATDNSFFKRTKYFELNPASTSYVKESRGKEMLIRMALTAFIVLGAVAALYPFQSSAPFVPSTQAACTSPTCPQLNLVQQVVYPTAYNLGGMAVAALGLAYAYFRYLKRAAVKSARQT